MNIASVINIARRKVSEVDPATQLYQDADFVAYMTDALVYLRTMMVAGFDTTIVINPGSDTVAPAFANTTPGMSATDIAEAAGMILAYQTAYDILSDEFKGRIRRGELGTSWKSGLDEESSHQAALAYQGFIDEIRAMIDTMILTQGVKFTAKRPQ